MLYLVRITVLDIISRLLVVLIRPIIHAHVIVILQLVHVLVIVTLRVRH